MCPVCDATPPRDRHRQLSTALGLCVLLLASRQPPLTRVAVGRPPPPFPARGGICSAGTSASRRMNTHCMHTAGTAKFWQRLSASFCDGAEFLPFRLLPFVHIALMAANSKTFQFKLVLLGDSAVGKSSLVLRFVSARAPPFSFAHLLQTRQIRSRTVL